nr:membrane-targeted effector domain-containing toxin [Pseudomonas syringae]
MMQTPTPVALTPTETWPSASAALQRLARQTAALAAELDRLPAAHEALLATLTESQAAERELETFTLLQRIDDYWIEPREGGGSRHDAFAMALQQMLHDEVQLKIHEHDLDRDYAACLPDANDPSITCMSVHVQFNDEQPVEIAGALALSIHQARTLLMLPGLGITGFATQTELRETLAHWLNTPATQHTVLACLPLQQQDLVAHLNADPDLYLEPFGTDHVLLQSITGSPFAHALDSLLNKQRTDIRYACGQTGNADRQIQWSRIQESITLSGLIGPATTLQLRALALSARRYRRSLPDWLKMASQDDLDIYARHLHQCDDAQSAALSVLGAASSPEQFATLHMRTRLADDLGYDLDPRALMIGTRRRLPSSSDTYSVKRSLTELALYGLHPNDTAPGSDFLDQTVIRLNDAPLDAAYAALTPAYLARLINELDLRAFFGAFQRSTLEQEHSKQLLRVLAQTRIAALAWMARMQGHIQPEDCTVIHATVCATTGTCDDAARLQLIRLNERHLMARLLVYRKEDGEGQLERLILVALDAPVPQRVMAFNNETQLLHELVRWTGNPALCDYVLDQIEVGERPELEQQLSALKLKPYPSAGFLQLIDQPDNDAALYGVIEQQLKVTFSEQARHTPDWYLRASLTQRQELLELEEAVSGALGNHQAVHPAGIQSFKAYVHQRASEQICTLLNVPVGTVDPDLIVITSERETLTYTDMLLNGYDDSINPILTSADTQATFVGPPNVDLSALSPKTVAGSVRGKWPADDYIALIRRTLLDPQSDGYDDRRQASVYITQLQMKAAALRSALKGDINAQHYAWLKPALDRLHLNDSTAQADCALYPLHLHVDKPFIASGLDGVDDLIIPASQLTLTETVLGCSVLLPTRIRLSALLYTPQAPDGIEFRLFSDFVRSLDADGMIDYYKDRCRFKAGRTLSFFLRDMQRGNANKPPVIPATAISDFADICFNRPLERRLQNVEETTRGRNDMLTSLIWTSVEIIVTALTLPFPPASFAVGSLISLLDSARALEALTDGDSQRAGVYIVSALFNGIGAGSDLLVGLKGFGAAFHRLDTQTQATPVLRALQRQSSLPRYSDLFPAELQERMFLLGKPDANGYAPVFHDLSASSTHAQATGQFAIANADGAWQPLAPSRAPAAIKRSLHDVPRITEGHAQGVCLVDGHYCIEMAGSTFHVQYDAQLRCWQIIDPDNPFAFFGKRPVRLDEQGQWQVIDPHRLRGGRPGNPDDYAPMPSQGAATDALSEYEMPGAMRPRLDVVLSNELFDPTGMGMEAYFESYFIELRQTFTARREKLYQDAHDFFTRFTPPPAPQLPGLSTPIAVDTLIEHIFRHSNGLVLSEAPKSVASKRLLLLNMPLLVEQRVEVIYIEHLLTDKHMQKLARYRQLGKKSRSGSHELKYYLSGVNGGALNNASTDYDYYHLIKAAHRHGIEVRPFSSSISYPFDVHPVASAANDPTAAQKMSNFFGHTLISSDAVTDPTRRWVALLDQQLATTHHQLPGMAELQGVVSIHVRDIPAGRPTRVTKGTNSVAGDKAATRCDFTIALSDPTRVVEQAHLPPSTPIDTLLLRELGGPQGLDDGERWAGAYGFVRDDAGTWLRIEPEEWTANEPMAAIQQSLRDDTYEMPLPTLETVHRLANFESKGLDPNYFFGDEALESVREIFALKRRTLLQDARSIREAPLPDRPSLPDIAPRAGMPELLETLYRHTNGVVIGESHFSVASKKLIIDNLPLLSRQNVKTLYMEHLLTDLHQADLDRFFETGQMSKTLLHDLKTLDRGHRTDPDKVYTFEQLVIKAREQGVEVRAIDCSTSYHLEGMDEGGATARQDMMSYFASRTMRKHQDVMGSHPWIALVGNSHSNTYQDIVPGIAELQGGIGLRVVDAAPGQSTGVTFDAGEWVNVGLSNDQVHIKGDYRVDLEVARSPNAVRPPRPLPVEQQLARPGMFLVEQGEGHLQTIVHRSRDMGIHRTPVLINAEGKLYLERSGWAGIHLKPFDDMDALVAGLEELNLTRVA